MDINELKNKTNVFKALSDEKRLYLLHLLKDNEKCACVLMEETGLCQSSISYHMKLLCQSQLVLSWQEGKWTHYKLNPHAIEYVCNQLSSIINNEE